MAKKCLLPLFFAVLIAGGAFAQERQSFFSLGAGIMVDFMTSDSEVFFNTASAAPQPPHHLTLDTDHVGFGGWLFFDTRFVELSVGFFGGSSDIEIYRTIGDREYIDHVYRGQFSAMDFSILGKIPFNLAGGGISIFPLFGFGYHLVINTTLPTIRERQETRSDFNVFRMNVGIGGDFDIGSNTFVRVQGLAYYRFPSTAERNFQRESAGAASANYGFGGTIRMGIGWRL